MEKQFIDTINNHRGILFKVSNLYCDLEEDKKDLFQEIVLQLWRSYPSFKNNAQVSTWMYRVALNTAITSFRKRSKMPERRTLLDTDLQIPDFDDDEKEEQIGLLKQAVAFLNPIEKAIIMLYLDEKTYEEIAEVTGISKSNVAVKLARIKIKLEKIIKTLNHGI